jgi:hypothetical protein
MRDPELAGADAPAFALWHRQGIMPGNMHEGKDDFTEKG